MSQTFKESVDLRTWKANYAVLGESAGDAFEISRLRSNMAAQTTTSKVTQEARLIKVYQSDH